MSLKKLSILILAFILLFGCTKKEENKGITVAVAANAQFVAKDIVKEFENKYGIKVTLVIGSSGKLSIQIKNGAPFHVFMSADMKFPQKLFSDGFAIDSPKVYAQGVLVLWTLKNLDITDGVKCLTKNVFKSIALPNPENAPYGEATLQALKYVKIYENIKSRLVIGESISQANHYILSGNTDAGFTSLSTVVAPEMKNKGKYVIIDSAFYKPIVQGAVITKAGKNNNQAKLFYDFLFDSVSKTIFKKYGFKTE